MTGRTISHYRIAEKLGGGGMGVVYRAEDTRLRRTVALKFLPPHLSTDPEANERFVQEAKAASALDHPNVCTIYDIGTAEPSLGELSGQLFIAMAYYEGETLKKRIGRGTLPVEETADLAVQIAEGLKRAHEAGIVHRDIKPANVMVTNRGRVKIVDFGLAKMMDSGLTQTGTTMGTVPYMSPEQTRGERIDHRTDLWSLGVLLYEMLTGDRPFRGQYDQAVIYSILNQDPVPLTTLRPKIPSAWGVVVEKLLRKEPAHRYQLSEDVLKDLQALRAGKQIAVQAAPLMPLVECHTVGREKEQATLLAGLERAAAGQGLLMCVTGEAGLGKTTFVENFFDALSQTRQPCLIARGQSSERLAGTEGYVPIFEALESLLRSHAGAALAEVMKSVAPTWYVEVAPLSTEDASDARVIADARAASQERKRRELSAFLQEVSRLQPLILFLDDLHWADVSTVDMLAFIGSKCEAMSLLIVVAYRPAELLLSENQFPQVKLNLQARRVCREIALAFLSLDDIKHYLALEFPSHRFPATFAELIHRQTEGSPLFMADLVRNLHDSGVIAEAQDHWVLKQSVADIKSALPASIRSMIQRKIDRLSEEDRLLLMAASVQGNEFDSAVVAQVLAMDPEAVEDRLEGLAKVHAFVRLLREHELPDLTLSLRYRFVHILYQNALYDALSPSRRASLSRSVADTLLLYYEDQSTEVAAELAFLFEAGRDFEQAADYFLHAAHHAYRVYANEEAVELTRRAIVNAEKCKGVSRHIHTLPAALFLGQLHINTGTLEEAVADFDLAEGAAHAAEDAEAEISAICGRAMSFFFLKQLPIVQRQGMRALELARAVESGVGVASAEVILGTERMCIGALGEAEQYYDRAIPVLREKGSPVEAMQSIAFRGLLHAWQLDYAEANQTLRWALEQARASGSVFQMLQCQFSLSMALGNQGRLSEAIELLSQGIQVAELNDIRYFITRLPNTLGWLYNELQDREAALRLNTESVKRAQQLGENEAEANAHVNLAHVYQLLGEMDRSFEHLQDAERLFNEDVWFRWRYNIRLQAEMARYWIARGDLHKAAAYASASLQSADTTLSRKHMAWAHKLLGDIAVLEDRVDDGQHHFVKALHILQRHPCPTIEWKILKASADLAERLRDSLISDELRGRQKAIIQSLADAVTDDALRKVFLSSKAIRER